MEVKKIIKQQLSKFGFYCPPHFLIIGAQKAGTTSLFNILDQHDYLKGAPQKELHFFNSVDCLTKMGVFQYHTSFHLCKNPLNNKIKTFEATPAYIYHPDVAERLNKYNPDIKLIILLREPVQRAFSAWTMYHHNFKSGFNKNKHDSRTFRQAIEEELIMIERNSQVFDHKSYIRRGIYIEQIKRYLKFFSRNQILIIESMELKNNFNDTSTKIQKFIDIPVQKLKQVNTNKRKVDLSVQYKKELDQLKEFYKPYNEELFKFLNKDYDW